MNNDDFSFRITNQDGIEVKCDTLAILTPESNEDNLDETYVIYTDYTMDSSNNLNVYVSRLVSDGESFKLEEIEDYENFPYLMEAMKREYAKLNGDD